MGPQSPFPGIKDGLSNDSGRVRDQQASPGMSAPQDSSATRIAQALARVIQSWRLIAGTSLSIALVTAVLVLVLPERYESEFSFVPQATASLAATRPSLMGLAQGLNLSAIASALGGGNTSSDYYAS